MQIHLISVDSAQRHGALFIHQKSWQGFQVFPYSIETEWTPSVFICSYQRSQRILFFYPKDSIWPPLLRCCTHLLRIWIPLFHHWRLFRAAVDNGCQANRHDLTALWHLRSLKLSYTCINGPKETICVYQLVI